MPYNTQPNDGRYKPSHDLPQHLDHKPVYALPYEKLDVFDPGEADVKYISIGIAQYDPDHVSVKTMRHIGERWTRQAEELPLHRAIDMTIFLAKVLFDVHDDEVVIPKNTFYRQDIEIRVSREKANGELGAYDGFLNKHGEKYKKRLNALLDVLSQLKREDKI